MATGTTWWLQIIYIFRLKSNLKKKSSIFQVFLFWAVGTKNNERCVCLILLSSAFSTGSPPLIWSIFTRFHRSSGSLHCTRFLLTLTGNQADVGIAHLQTSLRNSRLRHAGMWIESMVREDGLNGNKTGNMCLESSNSCWGSFRSCSCAWIVRIKDTVTRSSNSFRGV